jgi:hypothetical protein
MMRLAPTIAFAVLLMTGATQAQTLMTAEEFEAFSTGRTLDYWVDGGFSGSEQHLSDRRTIDSLDDGSCLKGRWFPEGDAICFLYEEDPVQHCWRFWSEGASVVAEYVNSNGNFSTTVTLSDEPVNCLGPDAGV